jgi:uncharacterized membrane protein YfcA
MERLILVALAGLAASLVDGSLGMGFGPTSSTILLAIGLAPAAVSFTVNLAKIATGIVGGIAHWRLGNVHPRLALLLAVPGTIGALVGVTLLAQLPTNLIRPILAGLLLAVGLRMLIRFAVQTRSNARVARERFRPAHIALAGFVGGITNGLIGAWGPVATPIAMQQDGVEPRQAIGSVNLAEIAVALTASLGLLRTVGTQAIDMKLLVALLIGGSIAAPIAAWMVQRISQYLLGVSVATMLVFTSIRDLANWFQIGDTRWAMYGLLMGSTIFLLVNKRLQSGSAETTRQPQPEPLPEFSRNQ